MTAATSDAAGSSARAADRTWTGDWRDGQPPPADGAEDRTAGRGTTTAPDALPIGADPTDPRGATLADLTLRHAMTAGVMQSLAVLPGVSRSGSTIAGGVFAGLTREAATRFSFLLVIPALVGATILSVPDIGEGGETAGELAIGMIASFVAGYLAIRFLVGLVARERVTGFAWYCIAVSAIGMIGYLMIGPPSTI